MRSSVTFDFNPYSAFSILDIQTEFASYDI